MKVIGLQIAVKGEAEGLKRLGQIKAELKAIDAEIDKINKKTVSPKTGAGASSASAGGASTTSGSKSVSGQISEAKSQGKDYQALITQAAKLKAEQAEINGLIRQQAREFESTKEAVGSYKQLNNELAKAKDAYKRLGEADRNSQLGKESLQRIQALDRELKGIDANMGQYFRNVGNYSSAFSNLGSIVSRVGGFLGLGVGLQEILQANSQISESVSDAQKTTGLTKDQVRALNEELKKIDTRTTQEGLLAIAEGAGRLGLGRLGVEGLTDFVVAIDKVNVALGDVLEGDPDQIATTLAKISSSFGLEEAFGYAGGVERVGAALNYLGANSKANENFILEVTRRLQGLATTAGITAPQVLGYGATLDELGLNAELSSSALQRFLVDIAKSPEAFAKVAEKAGVTKDEFIALTKTNPNEAFIKVLEGAKSSEEGFGALNETLKTLGLTGVGEIQTITALANNVDLLRKNQGLAGEEFAKSNEEFARSNSLLQEFNTKNTNLAASIDKAKKALVELVTTSGVQDFLQVIIEGFAKIFFALGKLPEFVKENRAELIGLGVALVAFNAQAIAASLNTLRLAASQKIAAATTQAVTFAQKALNLAMKANPIGLVIGSIALLVTGFIALYRRSEVVREGIDRFAKGLFSFYQRLGAAKVFIAPFVESFRFLLDLIKEGPQIAFQKAQANLRSFLIGLREGFNQAIIEAKIFGLKLKEAVTLGKADTEGRQAELRKDLEASRKLVEDAAKKNEEKVAKVKDEYRQKDIQKKKEALKVETDAENQNNDDKTKKTKEQLEKEQALRERAAENRLAAAKNILALETSLIENQYARRAAELRNNAEEQIKALVGTPEQIKTQTDLVRQSLARELENLDAEWAKAHANALAMVTEFTDELTKARIEGGKKEVEALIENSQAVSEAQIKQLELVFQQRSNLLSKNLTEGAITTEQFNEQSFALERQYASDRLALETQSATELMALKVQQSAVEVQALEAQLAANLAAIQEFERQKREALRSELDTGNISQGEFDTGVQGLEELTAEQKLQAEADFQAQKNAIIQNAAIEGIDFQIEQAEREKELSEQRIKDLIAFEERRKEVVGDFYNSLGEATAKFFAEGAKDVKGFLKTVILASLDALEKTINIAIAEATAKSLVQGDSIATFGATGIARAALIGGLIKGAFAVAKGLINKFEAGGTISSDGIAWEGNEVPISGGVVRGSRSHAVGGIAGNFAGMPIEIESGEFYLRNGKYTHLINKRATGRNRAALEALQAAIPPSVTSASRARAAIAINRLADGGTLSVNPLAAPFSPSTAFQAAGTVNGAISAGQAEQMSALILEMIQAVNARIDRIAVINDPAETLVHGEIVLQVRNNSRP